MNYNAKQRTIIRIIFVLTACITSCLAKKKCPAGFMHFNEDGVRGSCYWLGNVNKTRYHAHNHCKVVGGQHTYLVAIETPRERDFIRDNILTDMEAWESVYTAGLTGVGRWFWATTVTEEIDEDVLRDHWASGQPDNQDGIEWCLTLTGRDKKFSDDQCIASRRFLCEYNI